MIDIKNKVPFQREPKIVRLLEKARKENNYNLTAEELKLKVKLNYRWQEIQVLKEQLKKKEQQLKLISKPNFTPPPPPHLSFKPSFAGRFSSLIWKFAS